MTEPTTNIPDQEKEALKFLERDFNQSFQQMRQYDSQIFDIPKFMFTAYSTLIGVALGIYQFGLKENKNLALPAVAALTVGLVVGLFMFALIIRNRVYFVQVARYINEQREFFFKYKPMGFENLSEMYMNHKRPLYFNWWGSHAWLCYVVAALNSTLLATLLYILPYTWNTTIMGSPALFFLQLAIGIGYLKSRENKSASKTVFRTK